MRHLVFILLMTISLNVMAINCEAFEKVADYLDTKKFLEITRKMRQKKEEAKVTLSQLSQARAVVYKFPPIEELGFGIPGGAGWTSYKSRLPKSPMLGKKVGWEVKNDKGHARVRLDWDEDKGAHYNIEVTRKVHGKQETHKLAVAFECEGKPCTLKQYTKIAEGIQ